MNMLAPIPRPLTQVLDEMPEGERWEVIDGGLYCQAAASSEHNAARDGLVEIFRPAFQRGKGGPGGWWILAEQRFVGPDPERHTLEPDLAGWRKERMPVLQSPYPMIAPDWACEVISPESKTRDRGLKMQAYATLGVGWYWLVDPQLRSLEVFALRHGSWEPVASFSGDASVCAAPFEAVPFDLEALWVE